MRIEKDSMGEMQVADNALYGAQTQRAVLNFPVSNLRFPFAFIKALGLIKLCAAKTNTALGLLAADKSAAIIQACGEVIEGRHNDQFVLDIFQTGSGTSTNMNANEVIANRSIQILGGQLGSKSLIHPNDHVNMCQSSNDVIPSAIHVASQSLLEQSLLPALTILEATLGAKAKEFAEVIKAGRTHLQDATPVTLGQEFGGYAAQIRNGIERIRRAQASLLELPLGGTAVGTGINTHPEFARRTIGEINQQTGYRFIEARNHFEAQGAKDACVELSGMLKTLACSVMKIANDLRWLSAGPRCNLFEITLPEIQPGSSIMPAKVNPVICESMMMVAAQVVGCDACITVCAQQGNFELNVMMPVLAYNLLQSIELLGSACLNFEKRCISGVEANVEICRANAEKSLATVTALAPIVGYDKAAQIAKHAFKNNLTVLQSAQELVGGDSAEIKKALDLFAMTKPGL